MDFKEVVETYALVLNLKDTLGAKFEGLVANMYEIEAESNKPMNQVTDEMVERVKASLVLLKQDLDIVADLRRVAMEDIANYLEARAGTLTPEELAIAHCDKQEAEREASCE